MSKLHDLLSAMCGKIKKSDWNQNDPTAPDYVKNRPFYDTSIVTYIVPESTVAFSYMDGQMSADWPESFDAVDGQTYTISWDGIDYECEITKWCGITIIGNLAIIGEGSDTREPFIFGFQGDKWFVSASDSASEHIISIKIVTPGTIKKIDKKYLPSAKKTVIDATNLPAATNKWGELHDLLNVAYDAGDEIWLDLYGNGETLLKLTNRYSVHWMFMCALSRNSVKAFILTAYPSDGGSLDVLDVCHEPV